MVELKNDLELCLGNQDAKSYVLVSKLDPEVYSKYVEDKERAHVSGFAFVVISIVHVAGGKISEGRDCWYFFRQKSGGFIV